MVTGFSYRQAVPWAADTVGGSSISEEADPTPTTQGPEQAHAWTMASPLTRLIPPGHPD